MHSVENIPRYTADTVGMCDNLVYYLVMHAHVKPDSTAECYTNKIATSWSLTYNVHARQLDTPVDTFP